MHSEKTKHFLNNVQAKVKLFIARKPRIREKRNKSVILSVAEKEKKQEISESMSNQSCIIQRK
jgi:hypothetical protein